MKLNRELQRIILKALAEFYPRTMCTTAIESQYPQNNMPEGEGVLQANLAYLTAHRLIATHKPMDEDDKDSFSITHQGLDFLADDGGLSAILGVVTVQLHDDTIKSLIAAKIAASDLPQPDKQRYVDELRKLPAESTKHLVMKLIDAGLANAPTAWTAIQNALSGSL